MVPGRGPESGVPRDAGTGCRNVAWREEKATGLAVSGPRLSPSQDKGSRVRPEGLGVEALVKCGSEGPCEDVVFPEAQHDVLLKA